jgi:hypothetical protein
LKHLYSNSITGAHTMGNAAFVKQDTDAALDKYTEAIAGGSFI